MRFLASLFFASLIGCCSAHGASVWKVSDGTHSLYLGGTMHILSPSDYPLPDAYKSAYKEADTLVFETDIAALNAPEFAMKSMELLTYGDEGSLADDVSETTLAALRAYLDERGVPIERFMKMRPAMVGLALSMIEFQRMGLTSQGVDQFYFSKAIGDGKDVNWLETPEEQLAFIAELGDGDEDAYLKYSMLDIEQLPEMLPKLRENWRNGDMDGIYRLSMKEFKAEYPEVYFSVLTERNNAWLPDLVTMMKTPETEFVLVGTLHLPGENGVLAQLKQQGYSVEQIN